MATVVPFNTGDIWTQWITAGTHTATSSNYLLPHQKWWASTSSTSITYNHQAVVWEEWNRTAEELQALRDYEQRQREEYAARRLAREHDEAQRRERAVVAEGRAQELLAMVLTNAEREEWAKDSQVHIRGSSGRLYIVQQGRVHGNIIEVDEHDCRLATLCVAPDMRDRDTGGVLPMSDGYAGQILTLKCDEEHLREKANFSYRSGCHRRDAALLRAEAAADTAGLHVEEVVAA